MKKVAVQTFWTSRYNYGQILQGYALQRFLLQKGYDAYIIRFDSLLSKLKELLLTGIKGKLLTYYRQGELRHFEEFKKNKIQYSSIRYNTFSKLQNCPPQADFYIVGSDQVWTYMKNIERRKGYLLCFGNRETKKLAYAASFGRNSLEENEIEFYKLALKSFNFIGVREKTGIDICKNLGVQAYWVVDPVVLLLASDWRNLKVSIVNRTTKPNVFLYFLANGVQNPAIYKILDSLSSIYTLYYTNSSDSFDKRMNITPTIVEWISYVDNCDYVVTDSFHCTLFCIIFNKRFVTIQRYDGDKMNNRLISLLGRLGLMDRYVEAVPEKIKQLFDVEIKWECINKELEMWRAESVSYLLSALNK